MAFTLHVLHRHIDARAPHLGVLLLSTEAVDFLYQESIIKGVVL